MGALEVFALLQGQAPTSAPYDVLGYGGGALIVAHRLGQVLKDLKPDIAAWLQAKREFEQRRQAYVSEQRVFQRAMLEGNARRDEALAELLRRSTPS